MNHLLFILLNSLLILLAMPLLNRFCGVKLVPGKPLLWAVPVVGLLAWLVHPIQPVESLPLLLPVLLWLPEKVAEVVLESVLYIAPYRLPIAWALAFWFWRTWEWGRWIDLNSLPDDYNREGIQPTLFEKIIISLSGGVDDVALYVRHVFGLLPGAYLVWMVGGSEIFALAAPSIALALTACYMLPKRISPTNYIQGAELLCGHVWSALILASSVTV